MENAVFQGGPEVAPDLRRDSAVTRVTAKTHDPGCGGPDLRIDAAELAVRAAREADETSGLSAVGAAAYEWTEKHTIKCFRMARKTIIK